MPREINKKIFVARGVKQCLMKDFGVAEKTVYNSLIFEYETELAMRIRKSAVTNYGGRPVGVSIRTILNAI